MGTIKINIDSVLGQSGQIAAAKSTAGNVKNALNGLRPQIDSKILARSNIDSRLRSAAVQLGDVESRLQRIQSTVENGANGYYLVEKRLQNEADLIRQQELAPGR